MPSYQELETKVRQLERMVLFMMQSMTVTRTEGIIDKKIVTRTWLDLYLQSQGAGLRKPVDVIEEPTDGRD